MKTSAEQLRQLLTKEELNSTELHNSFDKKTLLLIQQACAILIGQLEVEKMVLSSVQVRAIVTDDIMMVKKNWKTVKASITFKEMNIEPFCLN